MDTIYEEGKWDVTPDHVASFNEKGYIIVRTLFSTEELAKIEKNIQGGKEYQSFLFMVRTLFSTEELAKIEKNIQGGKEYQSFLFMVIDSLGQQSGQVTWNYPGDDFLGMAARCEKLAGTCAKLMGEEIYHYHSKICVKHPKTGGQRAWHQDYGYWYNNGCLFPKMMTVFVAIDRARKESGCLEVLEGSHKVGRIEHGFSGNEQGADLERVEQIKTRASLRHIEMEPGDALFIHCNLINKSGTNVSQDRRMAFLAAYNAASNDPVIESHHPRYNPLKMVPNSAIAACENYSNLDGKDFLDIPKIKTLKGQVKTTYSSD